MNPAGERFTAGLSSGFARVADDVLRRCVERPGGVPGVVAIVTNRSATMYAGAAGKSSVDDPQPMTPDSVMEIFSCTKAITGVAVMQLVECGALGLDEPAHRYVPELAGIEVLAGFDENDRPCLRAPASAPTIRHLLLHTAGFGYEFFNADLLRFRRGGWGLPSAVLLFDPGTRWEYGSSIDWAGKVVEAVRGAALGDVMRTHIFEPLEMLDTGYALSAGMRARLATVHQRGVDGSISTRPARPVTQGHPIESGGSGLYAPVSDYMKFIRMILGDGAAPDGARVLQPRTIACMATDWLAPHKVRRLPGVLAHLASDVEFFPTISKSWGYTWMINDAPAATGRPAGALSWAGLANLYYWIDRANGLGGCWATQILPFIDPVSYPASLEFESAVYAHLM